MSLTVTTQTDLHSALVSAIAGITPLDRSTELYTPVTQLAEVPGAGFRNFFVEFGEVQPVNGGLYGTGIEVQGTLRVFMNYHNLPHQADETYVWNDGYEIWVRVQRSISTITGLINLEHVGFTLISNPDEHGRLWGSHDYTIRYYARGLL